MMTDCYAIFVHLKSKVPKVGGFDCYVLYTKCTMGNGENRQKNHVMENTGNLQIGTKQKTDNIVFKGCGFPGYEKEEYSYMVANK